MARMIVAAALAVFAFACGPALAQQFSADMVSTYGDKSHTQKIYVADGKMRLEPQGGGTGVVISDPAHGMVLMLNAERRIYVEMPAMAKMTAVLMPTNLDDPCADWKRLSGDDANAAWTCEKLGTETVNGRSAVKFAGASAKGERGMVWLDPRLKFVVKTQGAEASMELKNIKEGPQQASLFQVPAGYTKVDAKQMAPGAKPPS